MSGDKAKIRNLSQDMIRGIRNMETLRRHPNTNRFIERFGCN